MSPAEIIEGATTDGVRLSLSPSGGVSAKGAQPVIDRWLPMLRQNKSAIVSLLRPGRDGWSAEDWQVFFDERAGILEFDGGLPRAEAEARARECCVVEWLNRNPERSPAGQCLGCGDREHVDNPLLPYGTEQTGHVWLHPHCWEAWHANRKATAVAVLSPILGVG